MVAIPDEKCGRSQRNTQVLKFVEKLCDSQSGIAIDINIKVVHWGGMLVLHKGVVQLSHFLLLALVVKMSTC